MRLVRGTGGLELCIPRGLTQVAAHAQASTSLGLVVLLFLPKRIVYRGQGDPERGGTWDENKRKSCLFLCLFAPLNFRLQTRFSIANKSIRSSAANTFFQPLFYSLFFLDPDFLSCSGRASCSTASLVRLLVTLLPCALSFQTKQDNFKRATPRPALPLLFFHWKKPF